jgi:DNA-binding Lrp family transcriptional regulator
MYAYILLKRDPKKIEDLIRAIKSMGMNAVRLYGQLDVIVEVDAENELKLFEDYVRPITLIEGVSCNTYVAAKTWENKELEKIPFAYVFIEVKPPERLEETYKSMMNIVYIKRLSIVYGDIDIIASIMVNNIKEFKPVLQSLQNIDGVRKTSTLLNSKKLDENISD